MDLMLRNREARTCYWVGALVMPIAWLVFAIGIMLHEGGGSLSKGWHQTGLGFLAFYGILFLPICVVAGLIAMGLSRLIGGGIVMLAAVFGAAALITHDAVSSTPAAQLERLTGRTELPKVDFEDFNMGHTFSDGTSYAWVARCSPKEAITLSKALGLKPIEATQMHDGPVPIRSEHPNVSQWRGAFDRETDGVDFYLGDRGMIGGYSADDQRYRLYWWPELN